MAEPTPIQSSQTIVLLEENKNAVNDPNGTFSINLPKPIVLKEGDELQLTKAFVDTSLEDSNIINVTPEERSVTIQTGIYWTDITDNTATTAPAYGRWSELNRPNDPCRGQTYILQDQQAANLNTFLDWVAANNPAVTGPGPDFNVELIPLADNDPTSALIGKAEYIIKGFPDLLVPPADPATQNTAILQANMLNGYMNLKVVNDAHQFFFYHRDSVAATFDDPNGHTAIIEGWFEEPLPAPPAKPKRLGWKAKRNVNSTFPSGNPPFTQWFFKGDADGYNYFADKGKAHLVRLETALFPFNKGWDSSSNSAAVDFTPSVTLQYRNPAVPIENQYRFMTKNLTKYTPFIQPGSPIDLNFGITELYAKLLDSPNPENRAEELKFKDLPPEFKKKENGWGRQWAWFYWKDWEDPLDPTSQRIWDPIIFSIDEPPVIAYTNYKSQTPPNSQPIDQAFVNPSALNFVRVEGGKDAGPSYEGNRLQLNQITTTPVSNPSSNGSIMSPRQYTTTIDIPPKAYGYAELAQLITDKLNALANPIVGVSNNPADLNQPVNAPGFTSSYLFQTTYDLMMQYNGFNTAAGGAEIPKNPIFPNPWTFSKEGHPARPDDGVPDPVVAVVDPAGEGVQPYWLNEDGDILFSFSQSEVNGSPGADPHIVGAENFSLIFDDVTQSFNFLEAHTPFYIRGPEIQAAQAAGDSGNPPAVPAVFGPGPEVVYQVQGRSTATSFRPTLNTKDVYSGCFITDLQPRTLWFDKMKFSADILTHFARDGGQVVNFQKGSFTDASLEAVKTHPMSVITGRNKTGFFIGHDTLVTKNEKFDTLTAKVTTPVGDDYWNETIEVDTPVGLKANSQTLVNDDQAFYQIEISGINGQEISGQVYNNSLVQAIVGKYFSAGNFTQSIGDGVPYIHKGEPMTIQSVRVRILNTQNELEEGLGPNSSFVLTINSEK